jgi:predicted GIY-YIG superfamily endonuclease
MWDKPTDLYRHFDADDRLLYVGISLDAFSRLRQHQQAAGWVSAAVTMRTVTYRSRDEAFAAEARAIAEEKPLWNIAGVPHPARDTTENDPSVRTYINAAHRSLIAKQSRLFEKMTDEWPLEQWNALVIEFADMRGDRHRIHRLSTGRYRLANGVARKFARWLRKHYAAAYGFDELAEHSNGPDVLGRAVPVVKSIKPKKESGPKKESPTPPHYAPAWQAWA